MRRAVLVFCLLSSMAAVAAPDDLKKGDDFLRKAMYAMALKHADRALADPNSGPDEIRDALRLRGLALSGLNKQDDAVAAFQKLLSIDPAFRLDKSLPVKLTGPFYYAMAHSEEQQPITLQHAPPKADQPLAGLGLPVKLTNDTFHLAKSVRVRFGVAKDKLDQSVVAPLQGQAVLLVQLPPKLQAVEVFYLFEALTQPGAVVARLGSPEAPFTLKGSLPVAPPPKVEEPPPPPPPPAKSTIQIVHAPPRAKDRLDGLAIEVEIKGDPQRRAEWVRLRYRASNQDELELLEAIGESGKVTLQLPDDYREKEVQYYIVITGQGEILAQAGSDTEPFRVRASEADANLSPAALEAERIRAEMEAEERAAQSPADLTPADKEQERVRAEAEARAKAEAEARAKAEAEARAKAEAKTRAKAEAEARAKAEAEARAKAEAEARTKAEAKTRARTK